MASEGGCQVNTVQHLSLGESPCVDVPTSFIFPPPPLPPHAPMLQDGLALRGWRDRGSCFELRASSMLAPDAVTCLYEAEVLLLAPGGAVTREGLALLGLSVEGLQVGWGVWGVPES